MNREYARHIRDLCQEEVERLDDMLPRTHNMQAAEEGDPTGIDRALLERVEVYKDIRDTAGRIARGS